MQFALSSLAILPLIAAVSADDLVLTKTTKIVSTAYYTHYTATTYVKALSDSANGTTTTVTDSSNSTTLQSSTLFTVVSSTAGPNSVSSSESSAVSTSTSQSSSQQANVAVGSFVSSGLLAGAAAFLCLI